MVLIKDEIVDLVIRFDHFPKGGISLCDESEKIAKTNIFFPFFLSLMSYALVLKLTKDGKNIYYNKEQHKEFLR